MSRLLRLQNLFAQLTFAQPIINVTCLLCISRFEIFKATLVNDAKFQGYATLLDRIIIVNRIILTASSYFPAF